MGDEAREVSVSATQADTVSEPPPQKKRRGREEELRRVAEIVMVLSALIEMRAGKEPTAAEKALAAEARERLARACEDVRPKDLFSSEAVRNIVEDLGLNRPGLRPTKMSIAERVRQTSKKMEESRDYTSSVHCSIIPNSMSFDPTSGSHGSQRLLAGKPSTMVSTTGGFTRSSTAVSISAPASISGMKQTLTCEAPTALEKSFLGNDSHSGTSNVEAVNQRPDTRINGPVYFTIVQSTAVANYLVEKSSASGVSTSSALATQNQTINSLGNHEVKGLHAKHQIMKGALDQVAQVNKAIGNQQSSQGLTFVPVTSLINNHIEIARSVMTVVQQKLPDCPSLPLPSTDYLTKPLPCQICKTIITDVESLLVCDVCEKGIHLKCLQFPGTKAISKADWHCPKCLLASNGKPIAPKYGRVTRSIPTVKTTSSGGGTILVGKNEEIPEAKFYHMKSMDNENLSLSSVIQVSNLDGNCGESAKESKVNRKESEESTSNQERPRKEICSETLVNDLKENIGLASATPGAQIGIECSVLAFNTPVAPIGISDSQTAVDKLQETQATKPACDSPSKNIDKQLHQTSLSTSEMQNSVSESMPHVRLQSEYLCSNEKHETISEIAFQPQLASGLQVSKEANASIGADSTNDLLQNTNTMITDNINMSGSLETVSSQMLEVSLEDEHGSRLMHGLVHGNGNDAAYCVNLSVEDLHNFDWVGEILEVVESRTYYMSCCINGFIIKLHDNVIVSTNHQNIYPAKLLSLWEDNNVLSKLAIVNEYCLPANVPNGVSKPSIPLKDEVYATDRRNTILVSSISGLCDVLPEHKFREEIERRSRLTDKTDDLHSVFMCKWVFDESKGIFQSLQLL